MNVKALRAGGWTIKQIAEHLGFHPATVSSWLKNGGPPPRRSVPEADKVVGPHWQARIAQLLTHNPQLQGSSIHRVLCVEGYTGSYQRYPTVHWLDGQEFADLLRTHSIYRKLDPAVREPLLAAVAERIRTRMDDRASRRYLTVLRAAPRT